MTKSYGSKAGAGVLLAGLGAAPVFSWPAVVVVLILVFVPAILRVFTGWQRRRTLVALITRAPEGTVVEHQDGPEGESMKVVVGSPGRGRRG